MILYFQYQSLLRATPQGSKLQLSTPEIKLLIVFFFYALFGIWVLFYSIIATEINGSSLLAGIIQYFTCEIHANSTEALLRVATDTENTKSSLIYDKINRHTLCSSQTIAIRSARPIPHRMSIGRIVVRNQ